jgi:hypothetical protein
VTNTDLPSSNDTSQWRYYLLAEYDRINRDIMRRDKLFESAIHYYWVIKNILHEDFLDPPMLEVLYANLMNVRADLNKRFEGEMRVKTALHNDHIDLLNRIGDKILAFGAQGKLDNTQRYIRYDHDGRLLPILSDAVIQSTALTVDGVAFLYFLWRQGLMTREVFIQRLELIAPPCLIPCNDDVLIVSGGNRSFVSELLPVSSIPDCATKNIGLAWTVEINNHPPQIGDALNFMTRIPAFVRHLLAQNAAYLLIDSSGELSKLDTLLLDGIRNIVRMIGCRHDQIIYCSQNAAMVEQLDACRTREFPSGDAPQILAVNRHIALPSLMIEPKLAINPSKKFLCFNNRAHTHRTSLLLRMHNDGLLRDCHFSFRDTLRTSLKNEDKPPLEVDIIAPYVDLPTDEINRLIDEVDRFLPLSITRDSATPNPFDHPSDMQIWSFDPDLHADAAFYIVTETEMEDSSTRRFTEKTVKGLAAMTPFIVFGNVGTLASLRQRGFRTFEPVINESYDLIEDPVARFNAVYAEVKRLAALDIPQLMALRQSLHEVLLHNRKQLLQPVSLLSRVTVHS